MTNKILRGKTPSLIGSSNGRPCRVDVKQKSKCKRCGCDIGAGQDCFGIPKAGSGFTNIHRYCKQCYMNIIEQTRKDLEKASKL